VIFTALTVIFAVILFGSLLLKRRLAYRSSIILNLAFLVLYAAGSLVLINVAHQGGRLVHEFGVRAVVKSSPAPARNTSDTSQQAKKADDDD
jgi:hypothetical protein